VSSSPIKEQANTLRRTINNLRKRNDAHGLGIVSDELQELAHTASVAQIQAREQQEKEAQRRLNITPRELGLKVMFTSPNASGMPYPSIGQSELDLPMDKAIEELAKMSSGVGGIYFLGKPYDAS